MHRPWWAEAITAGRPDPLHDLFVAHGVDLVLTGHWHRHAYQRIDGIKYVVVGSSGGGVSGVSDPQRGSAAEFVWITVDGGKLALTTHHGERVDPIDQVTLRDANRLEAIDRKDVQATLADDASSMEIMVHNPSDQPITTEARVIGEHWRAEPRPLTIEPGGTARSTIGAMLCLRSVRTSSR